MHSRIIALNVETDEDEVYELMQGKADYTSECSLGDDWGLEILERIGTVDRTKMTWKADPEAVRSRLEAAYHHYLEHQIKSFDEFADEGKAWRAADALDSQYGVYIYEDWDGYPITWLEFLRHLYNNEALMTRTWDITSVYDYHF